MSLSWYYADNQRQQQGPVADSWLYNAYQRGEITLNTLVWREGMPQWLPLSRVAAELGIPVGNAAPPPPPPIGQPQAPRAVAPAKSGGSGCLVIGIILLVGFVVVGGILAAIAIPAYHDYVTRAKATMALAQGAALKGEVAVFYSSNDRCPVNGDDGFGTPESYATTEVASINIGSLQDGHCAVQILFNDLGGANTQGAEVLYSMDSELQWTQTSTLPDKYLPMSMRN